MSESVRTGFAARSSNAARLTGGWRHSCADAGEMGEPRRCCIACVDDTEPMPAAVALTEPVAIGPARQTHVGAPLALALAALGVIGVVGMARLMGLRASRVFLGLLAGACGGVLLARLVRPRYVRFSPGLVEVLCYWFWRRKPRAVRLPMNDETVLFVRTWTLTAGAARPRETQPGQGRCHWTMVGCRPERIRYLRFWTSGVETEQVWQALLSGGQAPALPVETL